MTASSIGIAGIFLLIFFLLGSMPVGFSMMVVGCLGFALIMHNPMAAYHLMASVTYDTFSKYDYSVIPLFIFMGQIAFHSGISRRLFAAAYQWLGQLPGGMGIATIGASATFGAICGSGPATAATMAAVALPEMKKKNYSMELGAGAVAAGGGLGMLIPPSVVFIVYGIMTEISPARLFMAGVVPGLLLSFFFCIYIAWICWRHPEKGPAAPSSSWGEKFRSLFGVLETLFLFLLVMGGLFIGWFTPTEAAAIGAFGSMLVAAVRRKLTMKILIRALQETMRTSCMILIIIAGALMFGRFLAVTRLPVMMADNLAVMPLPPWMIISGILLFYILLGTIVDGLALILMTIPIFYPVILKLGFDPVWFGVMIVTVVQIGVISPPVGVNAYVVSGMMRDIPLRTVFKGCIPFIWVLIAGVAVLFAFPQLSLWLPALLTK